MQGKIKWFSKEKGNGYIVADNSLEEYYFNIKGIKGADLPNNGDVVSFELMKGKRGMIAKDVQIIQRQENPNSKDERVTCRFCKKKMVPRLVFSNGQVVRSVCPYCGKTHKEFTNYGCLIAFLVIVGLPFLFFPFLHSLISAIRTISGK